MKTERERERGKGRERIRALWLFLYSSHEVLRGISTRPLIRTSVGVVRLFSARVFCGVMEVPCHATGYLKGWCKTATVEGL